MVGRVPNNITPPAMNFSTIVTGGALNENRSLGKISSSRFHGCVARRLPTPRCRGVQLASYLAS